MSVEEVLGIINSSHYFANNDGCFCSFHRPKVVCRYIPVKVKILNFNMTGRNKILLDKLHSLVFFQNLQELHTLDL